MHHQPQGATMRQLIWYVQTAILALCFLVTSAAPDTGDSCDSQVGGPSTNYGMSCVANGCSAGCATAQTFGYTGTGYQQEYAYCYCSSSGSGEPPCCHSVQIQNGGQPWGRTFNGACQGTNASCRPGSCGLTLGGEGKCQLHWPA
jgi:hypothetical protein